MKKEDLKNILYKMIDDSTISTEEVMLFRDKHRDVLGDCNVLMCLKSLKMIHAIAQDTYSELKTSIE